MHIVQCALMFLLLESGACKNRGLRKGSDSSETLRLVAKKAQMAHRIITEPMGAKRQEETRVFHWQDDFAIIPRQDSIPAKIWMTVPDKASVSKEVQVEGHVPHLACGSPCKSLASDFQKSSGW